MKIKLSIFFISVILCTSICISTTSCQSNQVSYTHTHNLIYFSPVSPTCTTDGNVAYWYCTECYKYFSDEECNNEIKLRDLSDTIISKTGHSFTNYISDNNATCTHDGTKTATCDRDGCTETNTITDENSALGHDYNTEAINIQWEWNGYTSATATFICNNNNLHTYTLTATITSKITKAATCQNTGLKTYTATVTYSNKKYTNTTTETLEKTSHVLTTEYREDEDWLWGYSVYHCENCSYEFETAVAEISLKTFKKIGSGYVSISIGLTTRLTNVIIYSVLFDGGYGDLTYNFKVYTSRYYSDESIYYEYTTTNTESFTFYCPYATTTIDEALQNYVIVVTVTDSQGHSVTTPICANVVSY